MPLYPHCCRLWSTIISFYFRIPSYWPSQPYLPHHLFTDEGIWSGWPQIFLAQLVGPSHQAIPFLSEQLDLTICKWQPFKSPSISSWTHAGSAQAHPVPAHHNLLCPSPFWHSMSFLSFPPWSLKSLSLSSPVSREPHKLPHRPKPCNPSPCPNLLIFPLTPAIEEQHSPRFGLLD